MNVQWRLIPQKYLVKSFFLDILSWKLYILPFWNCTEVSLVFSFIFFLYEHLLYDSFTLCLGMKVFRCILDSRLSDFLWSTVVHNCRLKFHLPVVLCSSHVSSLHLLLKFSIQSPFLVVNRFNCVLKLPSLNYCMNLLTFWRTIKKKRLVECGPIFVIRSLYVF